MERNNLEEDEDVPDEEVVIKMKKWGVQKMTTRDLVEAMQPSSHQFPGNSTVLVISIYIHHSKCFYSQKPSFSTGICSMHPALQREVVLAMEK